MAKSQVKNIQSRFIKHMKNKAVLFKVLDLQFDKELLNIFETEDLAEKNLFRTAYKQTPHTLKVKVVNALIDLKLNEHLSYRWEEVLMKSRVPLSQKKGNSYSFVFLS